MSRETIKLLARLMKTKRRAGSPNYVLMLGAGASMGSGVPATAKVMSSVLDDLGQEHPPDRLQQAFNDLWEGSPDNDRALFLEPHLNKEPSAGYTHLAQLIREGYFDVIVTFNFDVLLERALKKIGFQDFKVFIRGESRDESLGKLLSSPRPRLKIIKLHGSLDSVDTFLFSVQKLAEYPSAVNAVLAELTARDIIVCGYAFEDLAVQKAFARKGAGAVFSVDPAGAPLQLQPIMEERRSAKRVVREDLGRFDDFFEALAQELEESEAPPKQIRNPFKFLESHDEHDSKMLLGRLRERKELLRLLHKHPRVIHLYGEPKVGKTSLVRAGLVPRLPDDEFLPVYRRCRSQLEQQFKTDDGLAGVLEGFSQRADADGKHCVLVLDQFEKVRKRFDSKTQFIGFVSEMFSRPTPHLTVVVVATGNKYASDIYSSSLPRELKEPAFELERIPTKRVERILKRIGREAQVEIDDGLLVELLDRYDRSNRFGLAHIQAVCHLATITRYGMQSRRGGLIAELQGGRGRGFLSREVRGALDLAINEYDLMGVLEGIRLHEEKELIKEIMKIASEASRQEIAAYVRGPFQDLLREALSDSDSQ